MIHIKETEIIPLLKNAKAEYSQKITEGDPKDAEMAERIEETPHQKYYLSEKACLGILRRAEKRGKELPEILRLALIRQAQMMSSAMTSATDAG